MEDEDDGQHSCPSCGYGDRCDLCGSADCAGDCSEYYESLEEENADANDNVEPDPTDDLPELEDESDEEQKGA